MTSEGAFGMAEIGTAYPAEVAQIVASAARLADERIVIAGSVVQSDSATGEQLVGLLDRALALVPDDVTLMLARVDALAAAMQFKTAEEVLDDVLGRHPDDFEARMRKDHWGEWQGVFHLPGLSEATSTLAPLMHDHIRQGRSIQVVRAGVGSAMAIVRPVGSEEMGSGLSHASRAMWEPVWSQTPVGALVAHYLLVEDDPASPYRAEGFLPLTRSEKASRMHGYWLLQQLAHADGCFVILADGDRVLYNRWLVFPGHIRARLQAMAARAGTASLATDASVFQQATQWHMLAFDMDQVVFGRILSEEAAGMGDS